MYITPLSFTRDRTCKQFMYTGCDGNGNRFSSEQECATECIYRDTIHPTGNSTQQTNLGETTVSQEVMAGVYNGIRACQSRG